MTRRSRRVQALAAQIEQLRDELARAPAFAPRLAQERDTPSCRDRAAIF